MGAARKLQLAPSTQEFYDRVAQTQLTPRVKQALRLWATGIVRNKGEAAKIAGVSPAYLSILTSSGNPHVTEFIESLEKKLGDEAVNMADLVREVGRRAFRNTAYLMEHAAKEDIQFRAAQDLMDRSPELSKIQRHQVESVHIGAGDLDRLMGAMVETARMRENPELQKIAEVGYDGGDQPEHVRALLDNVDKL